MIQLGLVCRTPSEEAELGYRGHSVTVTDNRERARDQIVGNLFLMKLINPHNHNPKYPQLQTKRKEIKEEKKRAKG